MITQKKQREAASIRSLRDDVQSFREKSTLLRKQQLTNETFNKLALFSVKIYQGERKIDNLNSGRPALGYSDAQYSLITTNGNDKRKNNN